MFVRSFISGATAVFLLVVVPSIPDVAASTPLRFDRCVQQIGVFPIDASAVELPAGFRAVPFQDSSPAGKSGLPAPPGATATIQLTATSCAASSGADGRRAPVTVVQAWHYVEPPPSLLADAADKIDAYLVVPWMMVSEAATARTLAGLGLPAVAGQVTNLIERTRESAARGSVNAGGRVRLDTVVPTVHRDTTPERLRLFGVKGRLVTGIVDFVEDEHTHVLIGTARLQANGEQPFAIPSGPGVALHVEPGYGVSWAPVR